MPAEYVPTADQRALVENAAAFGLTQADIAEQLKIDEKTLRKHFQDELSSGKFKVDTTAGNVKKVWLLKSGGDYVLLPCRAHQGATEVLTRSEVTALEGCDGNLENGALAPLRAAESRSVLDESALVCGRHIFGWYFPFRVAQLRDARARGGKLRANPEGR
jgi:hypothetical protein